MMKKGVVNFGVAVFLAAGLAASPVRAGLFGNGEDEAQIRRAIARVYPALVKITVVAEEAEDGRLQKQVGSGSGTIIDEDGYVVTNHHVAGKSRHIICRLEDGREVPARLVGTDPLADIAVLQLDAAGLPKDFEMPVAHFGDSDALRVGDVVLAMGSPGGVNQSVTRGVASNVAMMMPRHMQGAVKLDGEDTGSIVRWIAHDAQIFGGNSGGPLVNRDGEIIGVNEIGVFGLGGAIPGNLAKKIAREIIETGEVRRSWTGLIIQPRLKNQGNQGILIGGVLPKSPALAAGLRAGDLIVSYDGTDVVGGTEDDLPVFNAAMLATPVGKKIAIRVLREGKTVETTLVSESRDPALGDDMEFKGWGMTGLDVTRAIMMQLKRETRNGVLVHTVRPGGPASTATPELRPNDVIVSVQNRPVNTMADLEKITAEICKDKTEPEPVLVGLDRGRSRLLTIARIGGEDAAQSPVPSRKPDFPVMLQEVSAELAEKLGLDVSSAARVTYVIPGRSAEKAGFKVGDLIVKMDGDPVRTPKREDVQVLKDMIRQYKIGDTLPFDVVRDGKPVRVSLKLEESSDTAAEPGRYRNSELEIGVRDVMSSDRIEMQMEEQIKGVLVEQLEYACDAQLAGLRSGDVVISINGIATPDVKAAEKAMKKVVKEQPSHIVFFVSRGPATYYLEAEPMWNRVKETKASATTGAVKESK